MKFADEDLHHADEKPSPVAKQVDKDSEEEGGDSEEHEVNGPECLWCDGEKEPEGEPKKLIDRVVDEVEGEIPQDAGARGT